MTGFTHLDNNGNAVMVDISEKPVTKREAVAHGIIRMNRECFEMLKAGTHKKGDVLAVARVAGIMGAKKTSEIVPLCHNIPLEHIMTDLRLIEEECAIEAVCSVISEGKTGAEMEALTGASAALLTVYDMCKAVDRAMVMEDIRLLSKSGGRSGDYIAENKSEK